MLHVSSARKSDWNLSYILGVLATIATVVVLSIISVGFLVLFLIIGAVAALVYAGTSLFSPSSQTAASTQKPRAAPHQALTPVPVLTRTGEIQQAFAVQQDSGEGYQMVLTRQGYMMVDEAGKVVHLFK